MLPAVFGTVLRASHPREPALTMIGPRVLGFVGSLGGDDLNVPLSEFAAGYTAGHTDRRPSEMRAAVVPNIGQNWHARRALASPLLGALPPLPPSLEMIRLVLTKYSKERAL